MYHEMFYCQSGKAGTVFLGFSAEMEEDLTLKMKNIDI